MHSNVAGWTKDNYVLGKKIVNDEHPDIICVNETHLPGTEELVLEGYRWFGHNRSKQHIRAPKGSGGVGIFVSTSLLDGFNVELYDKTYDGILGIRLQRITEYSVYVFSVCHLRIHHGGGTLQNFMPIYYISYLLC